MNSLGKPRDLTTEHVIDREADLGLCGEVLDIAGPIGGYNLQAAFSTGYVAGETAALDQKDEL